MELIAAVGISAGVAYAISTVGTPTLDRAVNAMARLVGGWRPDGWPRGVQEEDRDRPWGRAISRAQRELSAMPELKPTVHKVHPAIRSR